MPMQILRDGVLVDLSPDEEAAFVADLPPTPEPEPPPRREVPKLLIVDRLIQAGLIDQAIAALSSNAVARFRWDAANVVFADDEQVLGLLTAIGADPEVILAP